MIIGGDKDGDDFEDWDDFEDGNDFLNGGDFEDVDNFSAKMKICEMVVPLGGTIQFLLLNS